jgi:hypothetical protein
MQGHRTLNDGEPVEFEVQRMPDGKERAVRVVRLATPAAAPPADSDWDGTR